MALGTLTRAERVDALKSKTLPDDVTAKEEFQVVVEQLLRRGDEPTQENILIALSQWGQDLNGRQSKWRAEVLRRHGWKLNRTKTRWTPPSRF